MSARPRVVVVANIPSVHLSELFDAVADLDSVDLHVIYPRSTTAYRAWKERPQVRHSHELLPVLAPNSRLYLNPTLLAALTRARPDLMVVCQYASVAHQVSMLWASARRIPWVLWAERPGVRFFEVQGAVPEWARPMARSAALLPVRSFAREVWGIGRFAVDELVAITGRVGHSLPYCFSTDRFERQGLPYAPEGRVRFLFAGSLSYRKGFDTLCEAAEHLSATRPDGWELAIAGRGALREPGLARLRRLPVPVHDLGFKEAREVPEVMRSHDVFLQPSRYDGWGMALWEAAAAGMPAIGSDSMGAVIELGTNVPSWLKVVAPGDAGSLARAMAGFIVDASLLRDFGRAAARDAVRFSSIEGARSFTRLCRGVLDDSESESHSS